MSTGGSTWEERKPTAAVMTGGALRESEGAVERPSKDAWVLEGAWEEAPSRCGGAGDTRGEDP
jgi:hypothetical protein